MADYSVILDSEIDPESPGTTSLFFRLRDNPLALIELLASVETIHTTNGTFTVPSTPSVVTEYIVEIDAVGGGGSGGGEDGSGGGGSGAAMHGFRQRLQPTDTVVYEIGSGGATAANGNPGNDGGDTRVTVNRVVTPNARTIIDVYLRGGKGGTQGPNPSSSCGTNTSGGDGGLAEVIALTATGGGGSGSTFPCTRSWGVNCSDGVKGGGGEFDDDGGEGGHSAFGRGGVRGEDVVGPVNGSPPIDGAYGAGGGGCGDTGSGGAGASGAVRIRLIAATFDFTVV